MKFINDVPEAELRGKCVLVRAGLDVPLDAHGEVADIFRVKRAAETLRFLSAQGAKVIVLSHIGRDPSETNEPVSRALNKELPVTYMPEVTGPAVTGAIGAMREGEVLLLGNFRSDEREAANDDGFARELAALGDIYVDDAFSVAHRAHASIVSMPKYLPSYAGILMREEINSLQKALAPESPSLAILGGAKFETKSPLIKVLLEKYDHLFIAGALVNDVLKAKGFPVGVSLISKEIPTPEILNHPRLVVPVDITVESADGQARVKKPAEVAVDERIVDIGPDSIALIAPLIMSAKYILWNGPTGLYEHGFTQYTHAIAELAGKSGAQTVIGGADTIASIDEAGGQVSPNIFYSTGGGAMLDYLIDGTLPGITALG